MPSSVLVRYSHPGSQVVSLSATQHAESDFPNEPIEFSQMLEIANKVMYLVLLKLDVN